MAVALGRLSVAGRGAVKVLQDLLVCDAWFC